MVAHLAHNQEVAGSNPASATIYWVAEIGLSTYFFFNKKHKASCGAQQSPFSFSSNVFMPM